MNVNKGLISTVRLSCDLLTPVHACLFNVWGKQGLVGFSSYIIHRHNKAIDEATESHGFRGSKRRPEPDEALSRVQVHSKTGRRSLAPACHVVLL